MARPFKQGIDYFALDTDFFYNKKVRKIIRGQGFQSVSVLICLLSNIYRKDGYFLKWNGDMPFAISEELGRGATEGVVTEVLYSAVQADFFDAGIFEKYGVLTSKEIQARFFAATAKRKNIDLEENFLLVSGEEIPKNAVRIQRNICVPNQTAGVISVNNSVNEVKNPVNDVNNPQSKVKNNIDAAATGAGIISVNNPVNDGNNPVNDVKNSKYDIDEDFAEIARSFSDNIHPVSGDLETQKLADLKDRYGKRWVIAAINEAVEYNGRNIAYIRKILESWERKGFKSRKGANQRGSDTLNNRTHDGGARLADFDEADEVQIYPWDLQSQSGGDGGKPRRDNQD